MLREWLVAQAVTASCVRTDQGFSSAPNVRQSSGPGQSFVKPPLAETVPMADSSFPFDSEVPMSDRPVAEVGAASLELLPKLALAVSVETDDTRAPLHEMFEHAIQLRRRGVLT